MKSEAHARQAEPRSLAADEEDEEEEVVLEMLDSRRRGQNPRRAVKKKKKKRRKKCSESQEPPFPWFSVAEEIGKNLKGETRKTWRESQIICTSRSSPIALLWCIYTSVDEKHRESEGEAIFFLLDRAL